MWSRPALGNLGKSSRLAAGEDGRPERLAATISREIAATR